MNFADLLQPLLTVPGAVAAAFYDPQGQSIAEAGDHEAVEALGAYHSIWLSALEETSSRSGLGPVEELAIDFAGRRALTATVGGRYYLVVVFDPWAQVSLVRPRIALVRDRLAAEIG